MALWASFVSLTSTPAGKIYHVGDTGFHDGINVQYRGSCAMVHERAAPESAGGGGFGMKLANAAYVAGHGATLPTDK
jgi:L-ascorbate metabolism protein UlaG (beta-lactamase superfamily)